MFKHLPKQINKYFSTLKKNSSLYLDLNTGLDSTMNNTTLKLI